MKHIKLYESFIKEKQLDLFNNDTSDEISGEEAARLKELGVAERKKTIYLESPIYVRQVFDSMYDYLQQYDPRQVADMLSEYGIEIGSLVDEIDRDDDESLDRFWNELWERLKAEESVVSLEYSNVDISELRAEIVRDFNESNLFQFMDHDINDNPVTKIQAVDITDEGNFKVAVTFERPADDYDVEKAKEFLTGQYSDGWGEGFEQKSISQNRFSRRSSKPDYYIQTWNSEDWFIKQTY